MAYIQLQRRFAEFRASSEEEDGRFSHWWMSDAKSWDDVLKEPCTIIVGEGGTGKSEEFRQQADALKAAGKCAFLCRLEMLAERPLKGALDVGTPAELDTWCGNEEHAYFFLDSVDEAKLVSPRSFEKALLSFAETTKPHVRRATVVISTRPHAWQAMSDRDLVRRIFDLTTTERPKEPDDDFGDEDAQEVRTEQSQTPGEAQTTSVNVLQLAPLNYDQIKIFAEQSGVDDNQAFLDAVTHVNADTFANRPSDLPGLIELWQTKKKIGHYSEVVDNNIKLKLKEKNARHLDASPMGSDRVLEGAETIAAAVTLTGRSSILYAPNEADDETKSVSINPQEVLTQWQPSEVNALLSRSIFDESLYGAVRFHHRTAREYLAARWFQKLLGSGKGLREVQKLFFAKAYGSERLVVLPHMKPIVGWLAIWDDRFCHQIMQIDPKLLLSFGDASALDVETRAAILKRFANQYANQPHTPISLDIWELRRLASHGLATAINNLLHKHRGHHDLRTLLLRTIREGRLSDCVDAAATFATDDKINTYARGVAVQAVGVAGTAKQKREVVKALMKSVDTLDREVLAAAVETMWPGILTDVDLIRILEETHASKPYNIDSLERQLENLIARIPDPSRGAHLLTSVLALLEKPPLVDRGYCRISVAYGWLVQFVWQLVEYVITHSALPIDSPVLLRAIALCEQADHLSRYTGDVHRKATELVGQRKPLEDALFWHCAELERQHSHQPVNKYWSVMRNPNLGNLRPDDVDRFLRALQERPLDDDKQIALSALIALYLGFGRPDELLRRIKEVIAGSGALEAILEQELKPREPSPAEKDFIEGRKKREKNESARKRKTEERRAKFISEMKENPNLVGNLEVAKTEGKLWNSTIWLFDEIRRNQPRNNRWTVSRWEHLKADYGDEVAESFRDFLISLWRVHQPALRSEKKKENNSTPWITIAGLSGIMMESRLSKDWATKLSRDEATRAMRYAVEELNELPQWINAVYRVHPDAVAAVLIGEVEWEMSLSDDGPASSYVLSRLLWNAKELGNHLRPMLIEAVQNHPNISSEALVSSLSIVFRTTEPIHKDFKDFIYQQALEAKRPKVRSIWIAALLCVDSQRGMKSLAAWVKAATSKAEAEDRVSSVLNHVWGDRYERLSSEFKDFLNVPTLVQLIKIAHSHVKPEDDIEHDEAYSPAQRDHAQRARDQLLNLLLAIPGEATRDALLELSSFHAAEYPKNRMLVLAEEHAERDAAAQNSSWTAAQVAEFAATTERTPSSQKELYELALSRLDDLKIDLEEGDESEATVLQRVVNEIELRRSLANKLRQAQRGKYTIASEEEFADKNRTDIRLHNPAVDGRIPIEVKIGGRWRAAEMAERLENQLIRKYMMESKFGVFLVVNRGSEKDAKSWTISGRRKQTFDQLIKWLSTEAARLSKKHKTQVQAISVIGIDLLKRNSGKIVQKAAQKRKPRKTRPAKKAPSRRSTARR